MFSYFHKLAADKRKAEVDRRRFVPMLGLTGVGAANTLLNQKLHSSFEEIGKTIPTYSKPKLKALAKAMGLKEAPVLMKSDKTTGAFVPPSAGRRLIERDLPKLTGKKIPKKTMDKVLRRGALLYRDRLRGDIAAHELGHAAHRFLRTKPGFALHMISALGTRAAPLLGSLYAAFGDEDRAKYTPAVTGAVSLPMLADEAVATHRAHKGLKRIGASKAMRKQVRRALRRAGGTYLGMAGAAVAAPAAVYGLRRFINRER